MYRKLAVQLLDCNIIFNYYNSKTISLIFYLHTVCGSKNPFLTNKWATTDMISIKAHRTLLKWIHFSFIRKKNNKYIPTMANHHVVILHHQQFCHNLRHHQVGVDVDHRYLDRNLENLLGLNQILKNIFNTKINLPIKAQRAMMMSMVLSRSSVLIKRMKANTDYLFSSKFSFFFVILSWEKRGSVRISPTDCPSIARCFFYRVVSWWYCIWKSIITFIVRVIKGGRFFLQDVTVHIV
jgi:hypothetical protein